MNILFVFFSGKRKRSPKSNKHRKNKSPIISSVIDTSKVELLVEEFPNFWASENEDEVRVEEKEGEEVTMFYEIEENAANNLKVEDPVIISEQGEVIPVISESDCHEFDSKNLQQVHVVDVSQIPCKELDNQCFKCGLYCDNIRELKKHLKDHDKPKDEKKLKQKSKKYLKRIPKKSLISKSKSGFFWVLEEDSTEDAFYNPKDITYKLADDKREVVSMTSSMYNREDIENLIADESNLLIVYECYFCKFKASDQTEIGNHVMVEHDKEISYSCDRCSFFAFTFDHLEEHFKNQKDMKIKENLLKIGFLSNKEEGQTFAVR